jgi:hypothetical protein
MRKRIRSHSALITTLLNGAIAGASAAAITWLLNLAAHFL